MMPFSPLRTWGLGLLSWAILGLAAYCLWQWVDQPSPSAESIAEFPATETRAQSGTETRVEPDVAIETRDVRDRQPWWTKRWGYLAIALALLTVSGFGFFPVSLLLGRSGPGVPKRPADGKTITIERPNGSRLHVETFGPKEGPTIVLTHGWSLDSTAWGYQLRELAEDYRLVIWDLPGLGHSKGPDNNDYSLETMANDLDAVVQAAGKGPIVLVGHSIGGMITQTFCRLNPQQLGPRVAGIVLLHTTYTNPLRTAFLASLLTAIEKPIIVPLNYLTIWLAPLAWLSNMQSYLNGSLHMATRFASFAGSQTRGQVDYGAWLAATSWPGVVARGNLAMLEFDEQATLPKIEIPALVIAANHDRMTKREASDRLESDLPDALLASVEAGHLGYWERHGAVSELLAEFVDKFANGTASPHVPFSVEASKSD
jgi:pimeloyl-ACP methyl ester carboxylesterase